MPEPVLVCKIHGKLYHDKKNDFKKVLKKHNVKWKGKPGFFLWDGVNEYIIADFVLLSPEQKAKVGYSNKEVILNYHIKKGKKETEFRKDFAFFCGTVAGQILSKTEISTIGKQKFADELIHWVEWNTPIQTLSKPISFFKVEMQGFEEKKSEKIKELKEKYGLK